MDNSQKPYKAIALNFQRIFECPVCFHTMDSTLKQCPNGHGVCNSCARKIKKCPTCQKPLIFLFQQNTLLVKILEHIPKMCLYMDKGCDNVLYNQKVQEHQTYCKYRPTECKNNFCGWTGCVKDLFHHLRHCVNLNELSLNTDIVRKYKFGIDDTLKVFTPFVFEKEIFWKYFHRNVETKGMYHKLFHIPISKPNYNYYMVLTFKEGDIQFTHTCEASTDIENHNDDDFDESGVMIPSGLLKKFLDPDLRCYNYSLKLVKEHIP